MSNLTNKTRNRRAATLGVLVAAAALVAPLASDPGVARAEGTATSQPAATSSKPAAVDSKAAAATLPVKPKVTPQHIVVQHILIGFKGSVPAKEIERTKEQAALLAKEVLAEARKGGDFDELVKKWTDDAAPGIYGLANLSVPLNPAAVPKEYPRNRMVPAFGNVGFALSPGNIAMADYDANDSPYGWHIIKRLK